MNLVLLGGPGAGKGTQGKCLAAVLKILPISTGEILRKAWQEKTRLGRKVGEYMLSGALVPDRIICGIVEERIKKPDCQAGYLLDGFPRTVKQAEALEFLLHRGGQKIDHVLTLDVPEKELIDRMKKRGRDDDD
ncbi:MAG: nucleoside monophosphate kinase, partial [bacterium]|nr:nucleoside monophosphate kinase [bacterium]